MTSRQYTSGFEAFRLRRHDHHPWTSASAGCPRYLHPCSHLSRPPSPYETMCAEEPKSWRKRCPRPVSYQPAEAPTLTRAAEIPTPMANATRYLKEWALERMKSSSVNLQDAFQELETVSACLPLLVMILSQSSRRPLSLRPGRVGRIPLDPKSRPHAKGSNYRALSHVATIASG